MERVDLHIHTVYSDGKWDVEEIFQEASNLNLRAISITDHDCMGGIPEAIKCSKEYEVEFISGIEFSSDLLGKRAHVLAYFVSHQSEKLRPMLERLRAERVERAKKIVASLRKLSIDITYKDLESTVTGSIGRPHIAAFLVDNGYVKSKYEAFKKYLGKGKPAYHTRFKYKPQEIIDVVHQEEGVVVLAHPGQIHNDKVVEEFVKKGIDGIEVYYPAHNKHDIQKYESLAEEHDLVTTGGSDFHGENKKYGYIGSMDVRYSVVEELKKARKSGPTSRIA